MPTRNSKGVYWLVLIIVALLVLLLDLVIVILDHRHIEPNPCVEDSPDTAIVGTGFEYYSDYIYSIYKDSPDFGPSYAAAQLEVESSFNPIAKSEWASGIAQQTMANRIDYFPMVGCDPYEDEFNPYCGIRAQKAFIESRIAVRKLHSLSTVEFALVDYVGGPGNLNREIRLCRLQPLCDSRRWYGHVADVCRRVDWACAQSREYPEKVLSRVGKYQIYFEGMK